MNQFSIQILMLVVFIGLMYFLLIRPQKKKEKEINNMRNSISVGDEIVTIGGICGKVVKTKDDTIVIQVGADKIKFEMKRWAVSTVENRVEKKAADVPAAETPKKPKRLVKKVDEADESPDSVNEGDEN
ncbi:MAG: preprotein translocase subunit YajC [Eubacterium sp.]|nr:preprotein translocase subunit YajC [Eubacterium sp.]